MPNSARRETARSDGAPVVVRLSEDHIDQAADVLARAFFDDPFATYIVPDETDREDLLYWYYGTLVQCGLLRGEVYTTESHAGVAVWLEEGDADHDGDRLQRSGLLDAPDVLGLAAFERLVSITGHLDRVRRQRVNGKHWYLPVIGVDPAQQGHGCGSALLRPMLARADAENVPCYLETFKANNVPFYQRHGFVQVDEDVDARSGLRFWTFHRDPRM